MKRRNIPIAYQLCKLGFLIIIIISCIFMLTYYFISKTMIIDNINYTTQVFNQLQSNIEDKARLLENILSSTGQRRTVFQYFIEKNNSRKYDLMLDLDNQTMNIKQIENNIHEVIIEGVNGVSYYSNGKTEEVYQALKTITGKPYNTYNLSHELYYPTRDNRSFLLSTSLYDIWNITGMKYAGRISIVIDMDIFGVDAFQDQYDTELFLLDGNYNVLVSNQDEISPEINQILQKIQLSDGHNLKEITEGKASYIVNSNYLDRIGVCIYSITPKDSILDSFNWIKELTVFLLFVTLVFIIILLMVFSHNIVTPLKKLISFMGEIKSGDADSLNRQLNLHGYKEYVAISNQFNDMFFELNTLTQNLIQTKEDLYATELLKKQAELSYLKSQIDPHFLFNTLEVILGITYEENALKTAKMIKSLAKIFKYCVRGSNMVALEEEVNIVESYIHIQQTRFFNSFEAHYEFEGDVLEEEIPKMILQPLIENSIIHGLAQKETKGYLSIGGKIQEGMITLWIKDDGCGMLEVQEEKLQRVIHREATKRSDSIGFENVIHRLYMIYGEQCEIKLESNPDVGTSIQLSFPVFKDFLEDTK